MMEKHDPELARMFLKTVKPLIGQVALELRDGFDPQPRPVPPGLDGEFPSGHSAFQGGFDTPDATD